MSYTVLEVAKRLNISPHTIRYYAREGLLNFVDRDEYGNRKFKESDFEKLFIIASLKRAGMTIKQIRRFIELGNADSDAIAQRLQIINEQRQLVEENITKLNDALDVLKYKQWLYQTKLEGFDNKKMPPNISKIKERIRRLTDDMETFYKKASRNQQ